MRRASIVPFFALSGALVAGELVEATTESAHLLGVKGPPCLMSSALGGAPCPGCGLTRATSMLLDGEWAAATLLQPAAWCVVGFAGAGALLHGSALLTGRRLPGWTRLRRGGRLAFAASLLVAWIVRLT